MEHNLKFIVTGTGRSGSVFMAKLLTQLGIPCGHECIFNHESIDKIAMKLYDPKKRELSFCSTHDLSTITEDPPETETWVKNEETIAESSYMAAPYLKLPELKNVKIIHVVRNPLKVISSFVKSLNYFSQSTPTNEWENKIYNNIKGLSNINNQIERACFYYCKWNELIENNTKTNKHILCKLENIDSNQLFFDFIEKQKKKITLPKNINTINKREQNIKITDIPIGDIKNMFIKKCSDYNYI